MSENNSSFLDSLLRKEAYVRMSSSKTGKNMNAAISEVKRQVKQCTKNGNILTGEGVEKSGGTD